MPEDYKVFQLSLPVPLFEEFYKAFPDRGARSQILRRFVATLVKHRKDKDGYIEELLEEIRNR